MLQKDYYYMLQKDYYNMLQKDYYYMLQGLLITEGLYNMLTEGLL